MYCLLHACRTLVPELKVRLVPSESYSQLTGQVAWNGSAVMEVFVIEVQGSEEVTSRVKESFTQVTLVPKEP